MYDSSILSVMQACEWDTTNFLVVSKNVFDPFIYYSHIVPLIISITIGFFVLYKNPKQLLSNILFAITTLFSIWVFFDLILWATDKPHYTMFFWSIINLIEPFIYAASLYFITVFITGNDTSLKNKILTFLPLVPFIALVSTKFTLLGYDLSNCNREAIEGPLTHYAYLVEVFYTLCIVIFSMESFRKAKNLASRKQIVLITIGMLLFLLTFSFGNIIGTITDDWRVPQWGLFGMPIFMAFLSYMIVRYKTFDIKLIATQALSVMMSILIGSQFFFIQSAGNQILNGIAFLISIVGGILLVRSVKYEIHTREKIEKLALDLEKSNSRLVELDKQKTEFVSFASHQLRSPLTAIKGYASLILEGDYGAITDDLKKSVQIIFDSTKTLAAVVDDYLNVSRIELGQMKYDFAVIDFRDLVHGVVDELKPNIEKAGLALEYNVAEKGQYNITADKEKLKQVVMNIVDNSVKYTPQGKIMVNLESDNKKIKLTIKDTGIGISKDVIPKLFSKFSRATNANKTNIRGTGLGLFIAKEIVNAHKGKVWVESEGEGKGSTFMFELPVA